MGAAADVAPFQQFIVKLHSRCNLSCDYCYVYHHVDQSWRDRPPVMTPATSVPDRSSMVTTKCCAPERGEPGRRSTS